MSKKDEQNKAIEAAAAKGAKLNRLKAHGKGETKEAQQLRRDLGKLAKKVGKDKW